MAKKIPYRFNNQKGQALVLSVFLMLATAMAAVLMYNTGQTTTEKSRLVNAADAAAYSGAVFVARNLNFIAYTNRAMIANHVAIGHFVSYVSWLRYVKDSIDNINKYTKFIPYVGYAVAATRRILNIVKIGTEKVAPSLVNGADYLNILISKAQQASQFTMIGVMSVSSFLKVKIMDKVAKTYDPTIRVNYKKDVNTTGGKIASVQVITDIAKVLRYIKGYKPNDDNGRMKQMIESSYNRSEQWIKTKRSWQKKPLGLIKLTKYANTTHTVSSNGMDWQAEDYFVFGRKKIKGWSYTTVGKGDASAREFDKSYRGIKQYFSLRNRDKNAEQILNVSALATMPISTTKFMSILGMKSSVQRLAALSRAEIYHNRPEKGFTKLKNGEYANLYNPFWQVRLTKNQI